MPSLTDDLQRSVLLESQEERSARVNIAEYSRSDLTLEQRARQQLLAMSLSDGGADYRDDLLAIAQCYQNLASVGVDAEELALISGPKFSEILIVFVSRDPAAKML